MGDLEIRIDPFNCPDSTTIEPKYEVRGSVRQMLAAPSREPIQPKSGNVAEVLEKKDVPAQAQSDDAGRWVNPFDPK